MSWATNWDGTKYDIVFYGSMVEVGVSENRGPQYSTLKSRILIK